MLAILPPENSPYGRNSTEFFGHMLSVIYRYDFVSSFFICGDFNSRIGNKNDYIEGIDQCLQRQVIDLNSNKPWGEFSGIFKKCK